MGVYRETIKIPSKGYCHLTDITSEVGEVLLNSGLKEGICCVAVAGSTAAVSTMEFEPGLLKDIPQFFEKIIPSDVPYEHDKTWGDGNGFSHLRSFLTKTALTVPFNNGRLNLGTWQQIVVADFDNKKRTREVIIQLVGD